MIKGRNGTGSGPKETIRTREGALGIVNGTIQSRIEPSRALSHPPSPLTPSRARLIPGPDYCPPRRGCCTLYLSRFQPCTPRPGWSSRASKAPLITQPPAVSGSRIVLVIDDEEMVRTLVCRLLEEWGFKPVEADNGRTALQLARRLKGGLSMVITDLVMPHMDGYQFAQSFRQLYPEVPILFMTGKCPEALGDSLANEREQILFKPFDPDAFLDAVARLLESRINQRRVSA